MTEMKPEYHYSTTPRFCVELLPDTIMTNRTGILRVIRRTKPEHHAMKLVELHQRYQELDVVMAWIYNRQDEKDKLIQLLNAARATFRIKFMPVPIIFPADALYDRLHIDVLAAANNDHFSLFEVRSKFTLDQADAHVRRYSEAIAPFNEYSLRHWAQANQIAEAYRFTEMPSFDFYSTVRLWWTPQAIHVVYHEDSGKNQPAPPVVSYQWHITPADWAQLCAFMAQHFWTADSWYSLASGTTMGGEIYIFEGWRSGVYKFLDEHGPNKRHISYQAVLLFRHIIDTYKPALP